MNKHEYLDKLEKSLRAAHVQDCADILGEYAEHFELKLQDGYSEEETAAKLAPPQDIADQFARINSIGNKQQGIKLVLSVGLTLLDICVGAFFVSLYAWVIALGAFAIAAAGLGFCVVTGISLWSIIPQMPYVCALFAGFVLLALAVLSAVGMEYCRLYTTQLLKIYVRWHKVVLGDDRCVSPPLAIHPQMRPKKRRFTRNIALISFVVCAVCCIVWYISMVIAAGALEPWHIWQWFE